MNPVRAAITSPKPTTPVGTNPLWRQTYAFCRGVNGAACACEYFTRTILQVFLANAGEWGIGLNKAA